MRVTDIGQMWMTGIAYTKLLRDRHVICALLGSLLPHLQHGQSHCGEGSGDPPCPASAAPVHRNRRCTLLKVLMRHSQGSSVIYYQAGCSSQGAYNGLAKQNASSVLK